MSKKTDTLYRKILRKAEGLGINLCRSRFDSDALSLHGWTEVSDGVTTIMVELSDKGKLQFYHCIKHLASTSK
ncbi:hypothetical protein MXL48_04965 [Klebsiella quasipneumoniae]|uniref:hypothetical protein n=1 Tax=Klebsiella/Raoultella group TaxID=2890311 RepID=UPI002B0539C1|nr:MULTISPECIES: hypothetical protein [Klebsiella]MEB6482457.1 hypothetical protein [Klebsiella quasipneumoniae]HCI5631084.1 hypothetical protein [Klebsiella variicola subsp. variicola]HCI6805074.1 hypothetical protein [Klebsiella quasipneumoniae subsp. similipneumoniae]